MTYALYRRLLALCPRAFRDEYGEPMLQLVRDRLRDEGAGPRVWLGLLSDLVATALAQRLEVAMTRTGIVRAGGALAAVGGALWIAWASIVATRPPGIPGGAYRDIDDLGPVMLASLVLIVLGYGALALARAAHAPGAWTAFGLAVAGAGLAAGGAVSWWLFVAGFLAVLVASVVAAVAALRARVLPVALPVVLVAGVALLLFHNTEDARVLLAVPFGAAWVAMGATLALGRAERPRGVATA